ncbi:DUF456 domain-containing protein [Halobacteria archaeon AArc-m2/3/4]|uniref:DUF456 domain-containing protein n=1 Tax=Natronoglomus mannanivorans TaxID=2979990 RepID=A0ABT2QC62_9EURY|nr:DUF456 domain-containing protein [Halobacteria archaeon AArc-m2/3/4]
MSDRSDEVTTSREPAADSGSESRSTDELLEETERLLGGRGSSGSETADETGTAEESEDPAESGISDLGFSFGSDSDSDLETGTETTGRADDSDLSGRSWLPSVLSRSRPGSEAESKSRSRSRTGSFLSRFSLSYYFSPKAFLAFVLTIGAALFVGGVAVPIAGQLLGMLAITFLIGLVTSRRRYNEMTAAGISVGAVSALADHAVLTFASSLQGSTAVGITAGLLACLVGYYFGRDLRSGLSRDVD